MQWLPETDFDQAPVDFTLRPGTSALVVIDVQYLDAHPDHGIGRKLSDSGEAHKASYYFAEVAKIVPRIADLQAAFRAADIDVIHTRLCSTDPSGRDRTRLHKARGWNYPPGSFETEFLPEVAPLDGEIVLDKTTSGAFTSTNIDTVLRNLGIRSLVVTGVDTCYCVETTVRDAADLGYEVILVGDACATKTPEMQSAALRRLRAGYCQVRRADEIITALADAERRNRVTTGDATPG